MKIVVLERNSVGLDVSVDEIKNLGETVMYPNTTAADVKEKVRDAEIIVANKAPLNEETLKDADICFIFTEWQEVKDLKPEDFKRLMKKAIVLDGRNCYIPETFSGSGVVYNSIGRTIVEG